MGTLDFLKLFSGQTSREACLFDDRPKVDLSCICHESRSVETFQGEQVYVSLQDARRRTAEQLVPLGRASHVRAAEVDTTLILRVWAARDGDVADASDGIANSLSTSGRHVQRLCGELRIPVTRLVLQHHSMLYQSWLTLDVSSEADTLVAAAAGPSDDGGASFDMRLSDGPRLLSQPRVCLSVCKTAELNPAGKLLLQHEAPQEARVSLWGPLLRSQEQHYVMSKTFHRQHLQGSSTLDHASASGDRAGSIAAHQGTGAGGMVTGAPQLQEISSRVQEEADTIEELRKELAFVEDQLAEHRLQEEAAEAAAASGDGPSTPRMARLQKQMEEAEKLREQVVAQMEDSKGSGNDPLARTVAAENEAQQLREDNEKQKEELEGIRLETEKVREEANSKIEAANERIRLLRRDRDEARQEGEKLREDFEPLENEVEDLSQEVQNLGEQKESLLRIVEDLHETVIVAGLKPGGSLEATRRSIDSIKATFRLT